MVRLALVLALVLSGCQTLAPYEDDSRAAPVRIVEEEDAVANCTEVQEVKVAAPFRFLTQSIPESSSIGSEEIRKSLRYQTRLVGGDTVLRKGVDEGMTLGTAYDCE